MFEEGGLVGPVSGLGLPRDSPPMTDTPFYPTLTPRRQSEISHLW